MALLATTLGLYLPVVDHDFVLYDDDYYVTGVEPVRAGLTSEGVWWALTATDGANWFPLTRLSWMLDAELFGLDPRAFHATSALLHALATTLFFLALTRLTGSPARSALVAAIFAVHPLQVEPVAWVASRKDVLAGLFAALTLLAYERAARKGGLLRHALVALALAAGLMAKPMLVSWPFVLLLLDAWPLRRLGRGASLEGARVRAALVEKLPLFALAALASVITLATQSGDRTLRSLEDIAVATRMANALAAYAHYTLDAFWPAGLAVFYPHPGEEVAAGAVLAGAGLLLLGTALAVWQWRPRPYLAVGWLWYVGMLVPVIGLVQVGQAARADRYCYLPLIGLAIAVVWWVFDAVRSRTAVRRLAVGASLAAVAALATTARSQLETWQSSESLFLHALRVTERTHVAHINVGLVYWRQERLDEASAHLTAGLRIAPRSSVGAGLLAGVRVDQGRGEEAIRLYRQALAIAPRAKRWRAPLAAALAERGRLDEAAAVLGDRQEPPRSERPQESRSER